MLRVDELSSLEGNLNNKDGILFKEIDIGIISKS